MSGYDELTARGVTRLCHFTKLQNLTHIFASTDGIVASNAIQQDTKHVNDSARYDGEADHVCCTVEYPNSWFLGKAIQSNSDTVFREWVVLCIGLDVLLHRSAKFCGCNASRARGQYIKADMSQVGDIFALNVPPFPHPRSPKMLPCCPTDGQAEILIKNNIPRQYITKIIVGNYDVAKSIYAMLKFYELPQIPIYIAPDVLSPSWSNMIKQGRRPLEAECSWHEEE